MNIYNGSKSYGSRSWNSSKTIAKKSLFFLSIETRTESILHTNVLANANNHHGRKKSFTLGDTDTVSLKISCGIHIPSTAKLLRHFLLCMHFCSGAWKNIVCDRSPVYHLFLTGHIIGTLNLYCVPGFIQNVNCVEESYLVQCFIRFFTYKSPCPTNEAFQNSLI